MTISKNKEMSVSSSVRVRFAPSPTGIMHIGNLRTALLNFLFAKQKNGTFVLRIEDTDPSRNFDVGGAQIIADLAWTHLTYQEGPGIGGPYAPYFQSERLPIYLEKLEVLKDKKMVYPCFCTQEELEKKRDRQKALKMPPRYDRECFRLTEQEVRNRFEQKMPFIWRFKLDHSATITIHDLAHNTVTFELKNFSDFPLTRADGSFTFMFCNFVDDLTMKITHVFRGEDHLSNTAGQAALYQAFEADLPVFYHMAILCNIDGKKLSKRDFGFSLHDLKQAGYLPQAITNYLGIVGSSYTQEIMNLDELAQAINFDHKASSNKIKYDVEKLRWVNHQWIQRLAPFELTQAIQPFLTAAYPHAQAMPETQLTDALQTLKTDLYVLTDAVDALKFYFEKPALTAAQLEGCIDPSSAPLLKSMITSDIATIDNVDLFVSNLKKQAKSQSIPLKQIFWLLRLALMGEINGPRINDLITILGPQESSERIQAAVKLL